MKTNSGYETCTQDLTRTSLCDVVPGERPGAVPDVERRAMPETPALEIKDLSLSYNGVPVVSNVTIVVPVGARVAVVGPNGAGKSTLFKGLLGLVRTISGSILIDGQPASRALAKVAYVPQREEVDWAFPVTVMDVVLMGRYGRLGLFHRPGREDRALARRLLEQMGIADLAGRAIGDLSGGQQQRVFLARALAQEPRLLLLDEPFAGVDTPTQAATLALLDHLQAQRVTLLVSTHDLELACERFDRLVLLNRYLIAYGTPTEALTPATLAEAFGTPSFFASDGQRYLALTNRLCPPVRRHDQGGERHVER